MEEIVYFEVNNWFSGRDYPPIEKLAKLIHEYQFRNDEWCKENKLCVMCGAIDMSMNYCIAAPKTWVLENCPQLLTDEEYEYKTATIGWDENGEQKETIHTHTKKYSDFLCQPDEDGDVYGHISDWCFPEYKEENFGVTWNDSWWGDSEDDEETDENEE